MSLGDYPIAVGIAHVLLSMLGLCMAFCAIRLLVGPSLSDRVVALDLMIIVAVSGAALLALVYGQPALIDLAVLLALTGFISTVAMAWYIERVKP